MESATGSIGRTRGLAGPRREPVEEEQAIEASNWETIAIFVVFSIIFFLFGYKVVVDQHVIVFDALDRLSRALMVWHNDPPKLAAIGFTLPPLGTLALVPFALFRDLVSSGIALPLSSAI